ncbi:MAG: LamG domain-containing protein, partial [Patescibacteria group bacterium]|nr:LamG domain-containing protein [Patescibacteria group bacterium]
FPTSPGSLSNIVWKGNSIILAGFSSSFVYFYLGGVGNWAGSLSNNLYDRNWHYVTYIYDKAGGANNMKFFIDGVVKLQTTYTGSITADTSNLVIGKSANYRFNGLIDDVRIYSAALTQARIEQLYAQGLETHQNLAIK